MWSQRYEDLLANTEKLRETKNTLSVENTDLTYKLTETKAELDRTKAELAEANNFLHEMQMELTKWKSDVLGFRDEMRSAQAAQLEALQRVLRILGAEFVESTEPETQPDQGTD
jgi:chromosome segregation ATPase